MLLVSLTQQPQIVKSLLILNVEMESYKFQNNVMISTNRQKMDVLKHARSSKCINANLFQMEMEHLYAITAAK